MCDEKHRPRRRPDVTSGITWKMKTGCGNLYVTINEDQQRRPFELFVHMGKTGGCHASQSEAIARMVSMVFRMGGDPREVIKQLERISCHQPCWHKGEQVLSCADAIANALKRACAGPNERKTEKDRVEQIAAPPDKQDLMRGINKKQAGRMIKYFL